ncbi:MAG: DUF6544 family protein [Candidatus Promineifilaceae bacterium]
MNQLNRQSLVSLLATAQLWLERALPEDLDPPLSVTIEQEGEMEIRGKLTRFRAKGVCKAPPLSFNWQARLQMLPGVWIVAEDGHSEGQGWGGAKLWGILPMGKRTDPEVLTTQVVRNLGELPWLPSLVLSDSTLEWNDVRENVFEVRHTAGDQEVMIRFDVDEHGDVIRAFSPSRPYETTDGYAESPWRCEFSDHREFGGVRIPAAAVATYDKEDGAWEYFRGTIVNITY